jgi:hypothetical protein
MSMKKNAPMEKFVDFYLMVLNSKENGRGERKSMV